MIEYLAPSGGSGISNLKYIQTNLSGADFTKLNTVPLVLIPAVTNKTIMPIAVSIQYNNTVSTALNNFYGIGALSVLQSASSVYASLMFINTVEINGVSGTFFLNNYQTSPPNSFRTVAAQDTPIVLFDDSDQPNNIFTTFIFSCLYLEI
jgi:hypothetical protein